MKHQKFTNEQKSGAKSLLIDGLRLSRKHTLLLLFQNTFSSAAFCIEQVAKDMEIQVELREFTKENFQYLASTAFTPDRLFVRGVIPTGIVLLIEWSEDTAMARLNLLKDLTGVYHPWRIASMPGVDIEGLSQCVSDFTAINKFSRYAFFFLARAEMAILTTIKPDGEEDILKIPLKKKYPPIISSGEIPEKSWGNFPSGETFIVPDEFKAEGWVTVRGSIPMHPLGNKEWIRFKIEKGRIKVSSIQASNIKLKDKFAQLFFRKSGKVKCKNANTLAELGIGTNPGIKQLTGMPIFDEKKIGTIHIAFGKNTQFDGPVESCLHHDIVCTESTLSLKTQTLVYNLVEKGSFADPAADYFLLSDRFALKNHKDKLLMPGNSVYKYSNSNQPILQIQYNTQRNQILKLEIASGERAVVANEMIKMVAKRGSLKVRDLLNAFQDKCKKQDCELILGGLIEFELLR